MRARETLAILVLDGDPAPWAPFYESLGRAGQVTVFPTLDQLLAEEDQYPLRVLLFDTKTLQRSPTALVSDLVARRGREAMALITDGDIEEYLLDLRRWGLLQIAVKNEPLEEHEVEFFIECVRDPFNGFGLCRYLSQTVEMYNLSVATIPEKNVAVERVINHFATANFEIHDLYDVRLILEEVLNNSFFHAFRTPSGEEKYNIHNFRHLEGGEKIRIEYGSNSRVAGFTVTDNAGSLSVRTVMNKLERQFNREGLFDVSGRGLYLSRMLSSSFVINIEEGRRTQVIALFDDRRRLPRPKPFMVNYAGRDSFEEWRLDPDFD